MRLDIHFLKNVIDKSIISGNTSIDEFQINIDSRQIKKGEIFLALKGKRVDGHEFIKEAINAGAAGIIINTNTEYLKKLSKDDIAKIFIAQVPDTYQALLKLAQEYRSKFKGSVIGITGSIGKTSTKEMLSNILKESNIEFIASKGNQNTAIGISLNILKIKEHHKVAIFEMGISKRGEMAIMAEIVKPTLGIITYIGHSHMEGLGGLADIANEKREIFKYFKNDNIGIINGDQTILANISYHHPIVKFGFKTTNQIQARKIQTQTDKSSFVLKLYKDKYKINLTTNHTGRMNNALACVSAAHLLGISHEKIIKGIETPLCIEGRFEYKNLKSHKGILINDCYNANPESMKAALLAFEKLDFKGKKVAVLADMLELGVNSSFWHRQLGRFLRKVPSLNYVILVGNLVKWTKETMPMDLEYEHVADWKAAVECLKSKIDKESTILVKGSLGMSLNNLVKELT